MTIIPITKNKDCECSGIGTSGPVTLNLPVAPRSNARIRFAPADVSARAVPPEGALSWIDENISQGAEIEAVTFEGPGDPLAEINPTMETLKLLQKNHPKIKIRIVTLGIHGDQYALDLAKNGVSHVTLLVDAVDEEIMQKLYAWIRPERKTIPLREAVTLLRSEQKKALAAFQNAGCKVSIKTTVYPGYNDEHVEEIAKNMAPYGVEFLTLVPFRPGANPEEETPASPDGEMMERIRNKADKYLIGLVDKEAALPGFGKDCPSMAGNCTTGSAFVPSPTKTRTNVAVASLSGMEVDLHLGQAYQFLIYGPREDGLACLLGTRPAPEAGSGDSRWQSLAENLRDCFAVLASGAGSKPREVLSEAGITVLVTEDDIEGVVDVLYGGGKKKKKC